LQEVTFAQVGSKGMFTKEIEEALADGRVDLAVHSLKDLPTELPEPFMLAATPARVDPRDVFVSERYENLAALPQGARVGTSSQRRRAQLKALRPDIGAVEFRGNVDTRLRKLAEGQVDAILLAAAGLDRLEKTEWVRERLDPREFCPAAGQGSLGIETRVDDAATISAIAFLDDPETRFAVTVERAALAALGGGCQVPIGIHCRPAIETAALDSLHQPQSQGAPSIPRTFHPNAQSSCVGDPGLQNGWEIDAVVADPATGASVRVHHRALPTQTNPAALGRLIAQKLFDAGAKPLLELAGGAQ
jgi:hydroxymethylbilane synthase